MTRRAGAIPPKKRRRSRGPAQATRHAAFLATDGAAVGIGGGAGAGVAGEGTLRAVTEDVDSGGVVVDTAVGVAAPPAVTDGDMTRGAGAIPPTERRRSHGPA